MTETFSVDAMIDDVIRREGGFVDHPADRGGPTKFGITQAALARYLGRAVTAAEVDALSPDQAKQIYRRDYYQAPADRPAAGAHPALRLRQRGQPRAEAGDPLRAAGLQPGGLRAGLCRVATALPRCPAPKPARAHDADWAMKDWLLAALVEERRNFYHAIVARPTRARPCSSKAGSPVCASSTSPMERLVA